MIEVPVYNQAGSKIDTIRTATEDQIAKVGASRAALGHLREMIWKE